MFEDYILARPIPWVDFRLMSSSTMVTSRIQHESKISIIGIVLYFFNDGHT